MTDFEVKDYLTRHLEQDSDLPTTPELDQAVKKFCSPIEEIDFTHEGKATLKQGDVSLSLGWTPTYLTQLDPDKTRGLMHQYSIDIHELGILNDFAITNSKTNATIAYKDIISPDITVVFDPNHIFSWQSAYYGEDKLIFLSEPPNSPASMAVLFHEAGHDDDFKKRPEIIPIANRIERTLFDKDPEKLTKQEAEEYLRYERNAWAFALKKLKPFIGTEPFPEQPLRSLIHTFSLHSYSQAIKVNQSAT